MEDRDNKSLIKGITIGAFSSLAIIVIILLILQNFDFGVNLFGLGSSDIKYTDEQERITQEVQERIGVAHLNIPLKTELREDITEEFGEDIDFYSQKVINYINSKYGELVARIYHERLLPDPTLSVEEQEIIALMQNTYYFESRADLLEDEYEFHQAIKEIPYFYFPINLLHTNIESAMSWTSTTSNKIFLYKGWNVGPDRQRLSFYRSMPILSIPEDYYALYAYMDDEVIEMEDLFIRGILAYEDETFVYLKLFVSPKTDQPIKDFAELVDSKEVSAGTLSYNMGKDTSNYVDDFQDWDPLEREIANKMHISRHHVIPIEVDIPVINKDPYGGEYRIYKIDGVEVKLPRTDDPQLTLDLLK